MNKIAMKFGGTSVQNSESIQNVINIVASKKEKKVVVVSAIAKATNSLEEIARISSKGDVSSAEELLNELIERHHTIINEIINDNKLKLRSTERIEEYKNEIQTLITGISIIKDLTLRTLDAFRVFGELMSSTVIYYAMVDRKMNVELIDSRDIIKTNNDYSRAYPDFELTSKNINEKVIPLLDKNTTILVQGFIGSTDEGISTTMGRESSDFSGVIYGTLIKVDEIQIWTDVDGVLTADPNVITNTCKLHEISYQEMEELSNFGAKVLHKNSVKPAFKKNIPIRILNSKNLSSSGTLIHNELKFGHLIKSITYKNNIIVLRLRPKEDLSQYLFWEQMLNILSKHKPQIDILVSSNNALIIIISENNYTKIHYDELRKEFEEISDYELINDRVLITLVGSEIHKISNFEQRIFISNPGLKSESVVSGYNNHSFSLLINKSDLEKTLKNLHREFFEMADTDNGLFDKPKRKEELIA